MYLFFVLVSLNNEWIGYKVRHNINDVDAGQARAWIVCGKVLNVCESGRHRRRHVHRQGGVAFFDAPSNGKRPQCMSMISERASKLRMRDQQDRRTIHHADGPRAQPAQPTRGLDLQSAHDAGVMHGRSEGRLVRFDSVPPCR